MEQIVEAAAGSEVFARGTADAGASVDRNHFPTRLHMMLEDSPDGISWQPHGKVFIIRNKDKFVDQVLPKYVVMSPFVAVVCFALSDTVSYS